MLELLNPVPLGLELLTAITTGVAPTGITLKPDGTVKSITLKLLAEVTALVV